MKKLSLLLLLVVATFGVFAQPYVDQLLASVETNSQALKARGDLTAAQIIGSRVGNSLADPEVAWDKTWGYAESNQLEVSQSFDLPMAYINRNKASDSKSVNYGFQYEAYRQSLLLRAQQLLITAISQQDMLAISRHKQDYAKSVSMLVVKRFEKGEATRIDYNTAMLEYTHAQGAVALLVVQLGGTLGALETINGGIPVHIIGMSLVDMVKAMKPLPPIEMMSAIYSDISPALWVAKSRIDVAQRDIKVSKDKSLPSFDVGYNKQWYTLDNYNSDELEVSMSIPIFGNKYNVKRARAQALYAEREFLNVALAQRVRLEGLYGQAIILGSMLEIYDNAQFAPFDNTNNEELMASLEKGDIHLDVFVSKYDVIGQTATDYVAMMRDFLIICSEIRSVEL